MDIEWITSEKLEILALAIIQEYQPSALRKPEEIDILNIIKLKCGEFGYTFSTVLLPQCGNKKALGCVDNINKKLLLDVDMLSQAVTSNAWSFVAAHELGHLILHRQYFENGEIPYDFSEVEGGFPVDRRLEWQANRFASELLLPKKSVQDVVKAVCIKKEITNNFGKIYLDGKYYNYDTLNYVCSTMRELFGVSKTVAQIRLKELDLIIDERSENSRSDDIY